MSSDYLLRKISLIFIPAIILAISSISKAKEDTCTFDKTEVKISINPKDLNPLLVHFNIENNESVTKQIYFLDTPDLQLFSNGLILRLRSEDLKMDPNSYELTLKQRSSFPLTISNDDIASFKKSEKLKCEIDQTLKNANYSLSLTSTINTTALKNQPLQKWLTPLQKKLINETIEGLDFTTLVPTKAILSKSWESTNGYDIEHWQMGPFEFLELSTKVKNKKSLPEKAQKDLLDSANEAGVSLSAEGITKTEFVLKNR